MAVSIASRNCSKNHIQRSTSGFLDFWKNFWNNTPSCIHQKPSKKQFKCAMTSYYAAQNCIKLFVLLSYCTIIPSVSNFSFFFFFCCHNNYIILLRGTILVYLDVPLSYVFLYSVMNSSVISAKWRKKIKNKNKQCRLIMACDIICGVATILEFFLSRKSQNLVPMTTSHDIKKTNIKICQK